MKPGRSVASPRSITAAPGGITSRPPTLTIFSPSTTTATGPRRGAALRPSMSAPHRIARGPVGASIPGRIRRTGRPPSPARRSSWPRSRPRPPRSRRGPRRRDRHRGEAPARRFVRCGSWWPWSSRLLRGGRAARAGGGRISRATRALKRLFLPSFYRRPRGGLRTMGPAGTRKEELSMPRTLPARVAPVVALALAFIVLAVDPADAQRRPDLLKDTNVLRLPGMERVVVRPNLVFKTAGERRLAFDLYLPVAAPAKGARLPLVVF